MNWRDRIESNPLVCYGEPCIKGTWVMVSMILDKLAAGETAEAILRSYPNLHPEDISASLAFAIATSDETVGDLMDSGLVWECHDCNRLCSEIGSGLKTVNEYVVCKDCARSKYVKCNDCSLFCSIDDCFELKSLGEERHQDLPKNAICNLCFEMDYRGCEVCGWVIKLYEECENCFQRNASSVASIKRIETTEEIYWDRICSGKTGHIGTAFILLESCGNDELGSEQYLTFWQEIGKYWTTSRPLTIGEFGSGKGVRSLFGGLGGEKGSGAFLVVCVKFVDKKGS